MQRAFRVACVAVAVAGLGPMASADVGYLDGVGIVSRGPDGFGQVSDTPAGSDADSPAEAPSAGTVELHVNIVTGEMRLVGNAATLSGYSITSAAGTLIPDSDGADPFQLYLSNLATDITAVSVGVGVLVDGLLPLDAAFDVTPPLSLPPDLILSYGVFGQGGPVSGDVIIGPVPPTLTWDGTAPADWTSAHWNPGPVVPGPGESMGVDSGVVIVSTDLTARPAASLSIADGAPGGTVSISPEGTLAVTGNVTVGAGGMLSIDGALSAATVVITGGSVANSIGGIGPMTVEGSVALADEATLEVEAVGAGLDRLTSTGTVTLGADATLDIAIGGGGSEFISGTYTIVDAEGGMSGTFANVTDLGAYVSINGEGLTYDEAAGTVTLTLDMNLNPGDANLDGATDVLDRIIWNSHNFTEGTTFVTGDWNNDGATDVLDRIIWNSHNFTEATATPVPLGATAVPIRSPSRPRCLFWPSVACQCFDGGGGRQCSARHVARRCSGARSFGKPRTIDRGPIEGPGKGPRR